MPYLPATLAIACEMLFDHIDRHSDDEIPAKDRVQEEIRKDRFEGLTERGC
jgi:hypothetical protein